MKFRFVLILLFCGIQIAIKANVGGYAVYILPPNAFCVKCSSPLRYLNYISDEDKPFFVFSEKDKSTYISTLTLNNLENYPKDKILFSDSLINLFGKDYYGKLIICDTLLPIQSILMKEDFNPFWLKIILKSSEIQTNDIDKQVILSRNLIQSSSFSYDIFLNPELKTFYFLERDSLKYQINLDLNLKRKIIKSLFQDTKKLYMFELNQKIIDERKLDMSQFGSFNTIKDTLITFVNISDLILKNNSYTLWRYQFICKFYDGQLIESFPLKFIPKRITFDEYEMGGLFYRNDTLFVRSNSYNRFDKLKRSNNIGIFVKENDFYVLRSFLKSKIPRNIYNKSKKSSLDYTLSSFFDQSERPNYFFVNSNLAYFNGNIKEIIKKFDFYSNEETGFVVAAKSHAGFVFSFVNLAQKGFFINVLSEDGQNILLKPTISNPSSFVFTRNGYTILDYDNRKIYRKSIF